MTRWLMRVPTCGGWGNQLALNHYVPGSRTDRLLQFAEYVKLDFRIADADALRKTKGRLAEMGIALVAENVETGAEFERAVPKVTATSRATVSLVR